MQRSIIKKTAALLTSFSLIGMILLCLSPKAEAAFDLGSRILPISNSDFEESNDTYFEGFENSSAGNFYLEIDENGYEGGRSPLINKTGVGYFRMTTETAVEVSENQSYEFTYNAEMAGDDGAARQYVQIDQLDANGNSLGKLNSEAVTENTDGWQEYKYSFTVSAGVKSIYISLCFDTEGVSSPEGSAAASWGNIALRGFGEGEAPEEIVIENGDFQLTNDDPRSLFEYFTVGAISNVEYSVDETGFDPENTGSGLKAPKLVKGAQGALNLQYNKPIPVKPGKTYEISYWVKIEGENGAVRQFCNLHENGPFSSYTAVNNPPLTTNTNGWQKITFQTEFDPKCTSVDIILVIDSDMYQCQNPDGSATVWYGEVTMREVTEEDPYTHIPNGDFQQTTVGAPHYFDSYLASENVENFTLSIAENAFDPENTGSGKKAPKIEKTGAGSWRMETKDNFSFKQNSEYEFSYWVKIEGENGAARQFMALQMLDADKNPVGGYSYVHPVFLRENTDGWQKITFNIKPEDVDPNCRYIKLIQNIDSDCAKPDGSSIIYFGEMTMKEILGDQSVIFIPNSNFKSAAGASFDNWKLSTDIENTSQKMDPDGYNGSKSPMLVKPGAGQFIMLTESEITVKPDTTYELSFAAKVKGNEGAARYYPGIQQYSKSDGSFQGWLFPRIYFGNHDWKIIKVRFTTGPKTDSILLQMTLDDLENGSGIFDQEETVYASFDNITLTESEPYDARSNFSFEIGDDYPEAWNVHEAADCSISLTDKDGGLPGHGRGVQFDVKSKNPDAVYAQLYSWPLEVKPNTTYMLKYFVKQDATYSGKTVGQVYQAYSNGAEPPRTFWTEDYLVTYGTEGWTEVRVFARTLPDVDRAEIRFFCYGSDTLSVVDEVSFEEVPDDMNFDFENTEHDEITDREVPIGWSFGQNRDNNPEFKTDTTYYHSGSKSVYLRKNNLNDYSVLESGNYIEVTEGVTYEFSGWFRARNSIDTRLKFQMVGYDENYWPVQTFYGPRYVLSGSSEASEWQQAKYSRQITEGKGIKYVKLSLYVEQGSAEIWFDDITFGEAYASGKSIVDHGDFHAVDEKGNISGWERRSVSGNPQFAIEGGKGKITVKSGDEGYYVYNSEFLMPGYSYKILGNYKSTGAAELSVRYLDYNENVMPGLEKSVKLPPSSDWQLFELDVVAPSATTADILFGSSVEGEYYITNISIVETGAPQSSSYWESDWICYPGAYTYGDGIADYHYFRDTFYLEDDVTYAPLQITGDDRYELWVNGQYIGATRTDMTNGAWNYVNTYDLVPYLKRGKNVIAVEHYNVDSYSGFIYYCKATYKNGSQVKIMSEGEKQRCSDVKTEGWNQVDFDDSSWLTSFSIGKPPVSPWGNLAFDNSLYVDCLLDVVDFNYPENVKKNETIEFDATFKLSRAVEKDFEIKINFWKRNTIDNVATAVLDIVSGGSPTEWPVGKEFTVRFKTVVPKYVDPGVYTIQLDPNFIQVNNADVFENKIIDTTIEQDVSEIPMDAKMEVRDGKPTVVINGEEQASIFYMRPESQSVFEATNQNKMVESGIELYSDCNGYLGKMEIWQQNGINFEKFDQDILQTLSANPDAKLQVSVWMQAPNWWLQKNPGHQSVGLGKDGQVYTEDFGVSPASDLFREEAGEVLRQLVQHVIDAPYGNQVYSFRITMGKTHEAIAPGYDEFTIPDYSEIAGIKYKEWLRERYGNDVSKLRKAWNNDTVTFETAEIPTVPERASSDYVSIYDPASQRNCLDYGLFLSDVIAEDIIYFSEIVKEVTNNTRLVGTYYGYINSFTAAHASVAAHNSLEKILNCPTIDWIMSPLNYGERDFGNSSTTMTVMDGAMAHGKLVYLECDNRTVFSYPNNGRQEEAMSNISMGVCYSMKETIAQLKRDFAYALSHGAGMEICDLWGGWFTDSQICSLLREVKAEMDFANNIDYESKAEIAVVLSDKTNLYTVFNQDNIYPMLYSLWNSQRQNLNTSGVPFDTYTISDVAEGKANDYSVYLMLSPFEISAEERAAIDVDVY